MAAAVKARGYTTPVLVDEDGRVAGTYGVRGTPTALPDRAAGGHSGSRHRRSAMGRGGGPRAAPGPPDVRNPGSAAMTAFGAVSSSTDPGALAGLQPGRLGHRHRPVLLAAASLRRDAARAEPSGSPGRRSPECDESPDPADDSGVPGGGGLRAWPWRRSLSVRGGSLCADRRAGPSRFASPSCRRLPDLAGWPSIGAVRPAMAFMPREAPRDPRSCIACIIPGFTPTSRSSSRSSRAFAPTTGHSATCRRSPP